MIAGLDSAFPPSPDAALAAKAGGVRLWSGYLSSVPYDGLSHFGLYHPWPPEGFEYARLCGASPIAFCSGWDAPGALKALAEGWNLRLCLDVESGIRPDGPWVQPWLDASGAGLYGNAPVHRGRSAAFYVLAAYPGVGDPAGTWNLTPRPAGPCAWQWVGTHTEFGVSVDRGDYDDWFAAHFSGGLDGLLEDTMKVVRGINAPPGYVDPSGPDAAYITNGVVKMHILSPANERAFWTLCGQTETLLIDQDALDRIPRVAPVPEAGFGPELDLGALRPAAGGGLTAAQAQTLADVHDMLARIETALKAA